MGKGLGEVVDLGGIKIIRTKHGRQTALHFQPSTAKVINEDGKRADSEQSQCWGQFETWSNPASEGLRLRMPSMRCWKSLRLGLLKSSSGAHPKLKACKCRETRDRAAQSSA